MIPQDDYGKAKKVLKDNSPLIDRKLLKLFEITSKITRQTRLLTWYDDEEKKSQSMIWKKLAGKKVPLEKLCLVDEWNQTYKILQDLNQRL